MNVQPFIVYVQVPHQYKLQGYQPHGVHQAASGYVPTHRIRELRVGAEVSIIFFPFIDIDIVCVAENFL